MPCFRDRLRPGYFSRIEVNFDLLRQWGELDAHALRTLEHGHPGAPILFMGKLDHDDVDGKNVCIGIKTGRHVYPMNMFFISEAAAVECCTPTDEEPQTVEPY